jgi:hypothetical protein
MGKKRKKVPRSATPCYLGEFECRACGQYTTKLCLWSGDDGAAAYFIEGEQREASDGPAWYWDATDIIDANSAEDVIGFVCSPGCLVNLVRHAFEMLELGV